jgi:hypothetical protein
MQIQGFLLLPSSKVLLEPALRAGTFTGVLISECGYIAKWWLLTMALTDLEIKKAKTKERPYKLSDGGNMYLWITPAGGKLWRWVFRCEGKAKLMTFGRYPDVPLALARDRLAEARKPEIINDPERFGAANVFSFVVRGTASRP